MCGGGKSARAAADQAAREQTRQAEIERARIAEEARVAKEEADRRYAEEAARQEARLAEERANAEALRKQIADQEGFRLSEMARIEAARKAEREADLAAQERIRNEDIARQTGQRAEDLARQKAESDAILARQAKERADAEAAAADRARALGQYSTNRQTTIDAARRQIEGAFGGYDDNHFNSFAQSYIDAAKPQVARQYDDAKRETTFGFARRGNLKSTAAARQFGRLDETRAEAEANIGQQAQNAAAQYRSTVDSQRQNLLSSVFGAANAAPVVTADNIGEAGASLDYLNSALSNPISTAGNIAGRIAAPSFAPLSNIFATAQSKAAAPRTGTSAGSVPVVSNSGSSGRLVL